MSLESVFIPPRVVYGGTVSLLWLFSFILYGYGFLSRCFTDRREILHGGLAISRTGLLLFRWDSPRDGRVLGVNRAPYGGMYFLLKHLFFVFHFTSNVFNDVELGRNIWHVASDPIHRNVRTRSRTRTQNLRTRTPKCPRPHVSGAHYH